MKFIRSKINYLKNEIETYYKDDNDKIIKKKHKFNKLLPYNNLKHNEADIKILPSNYYDLKTEKLKSNENIYEDIYETKSDLYKDIYNKEFRYDQTFQTNFLEKSLDQKGNEVANGSYAPLV